MNKVNFFIAILMLGLFSSASFASIKNDGKNIDTGYSFNNDDLKGHWSGKPDKTWVKAVEDHKHCDLKDDKGWGSFGHGHHEGHGHQEGHGHDGHGNPEDGGPSAVPLPPAIWLFGSALMGLVGFKRKAGFSRMAA
jgi:hypothetical protein